MTEGEGKGEGKIGKGIVERGRRRGEEGTIGRELRVEGND